MNWIWRLCNIVFESGVLPGDWRSAVIFQCTRAKERRLNVVVIEVKKKKNVSE